MRYGAFIRKIADFVNHIENVKMPLYLWFFYFYTSVVIRGILEGLLEYHKTIPPMYAVLLHFPLWYLNVFLSLALIVSFFTKEKIEKTLKVVFIFTPLLLIVPVFDFFVSGGQGYMLGYAYDIESLKRVFFSVGGIIDGSLVSPGQSLLYWLGISMLSIYCFLKGVKNRKIILMIVVTYLVICAYASVKFIVCTTASYLKLDCNYNVGSILFLSAIAITQLAYLKFLSKMDFRF